MSQTRVLFYVPYGGWTVHNQVEAAIASALRVRGAEVMVVGCDGLFSERCYILSGSKTPEADCAHCTKTGVDFFGAFQLPLVQLRSALQKGDYDGIDSWLNDQDPAHFPELTFEEIPVGKLTSPAVCGFHTIGPTLLREADPQYTHRLYLKYWLLTYAGLNRIFEQFKPTHTVIFHGAGFSHSAALSLSKKRGVPIVTHEKGWVPRSFLMAIDETVIGPYSRAKSSRAWLPYPLSAEEVKKAGELFTDWEEGKNRVTGRFFSYSTDPTRLREHLGIPSDARIFSVFTTSEHEILYLDEWGILHEQVLMIERLAEIFRSRKEYLVIRHHPNVCNPLHPGPDSDYLERLLALSQRLPSNVRMIMPYESVNSYSLLWHSDATFSTISTIGLEAVARGIPSASLSCSSFSASMQMTLESLEPSDLERMVNDLLSTPLSASLEQIAKAYRVLFTQMFRFPLTFKTIGVDENRRPEIKIESVEQLLPGADPVMDRVCDYFLRGTSLHEIPGDNAQNRNEHDERNALAEERERFVQARALARGSAQTQAPLPLSMAVVLARYTDGEAQQPWWLGRQRTKQYRFYPAQVPSHADWREQLISLQRVIMEREEALVLPAHPSCEYDECLMQSSSEAISCSERHIDAVLWGAWLYDKNSKLISGAYTPYHKVSSWEELLKHMPQLGTVTGQLGLGVFRRDFLVRLLSEMGAAKNEQVAAFELFRLLSGDAVLRLEQPMVFYKQDLQG